MPLGHVLEHRLGLPVFVENDSRVHARNEIDHSDPHHVGVVIYLADSVGLALVMENEVFRGYSNRAGDNRFFGPSRDSLQELIRTNDILYELTSQPYYSSLDRKIIQDLNQRVAEHLLAKPENEVVIEEFIKQLTKLVLVMINIFNPKRILLTGNVFDYTDVVYRGVKQRILMSDKIYLTPVVRRTASLDNPLETALVQFTLEKFFSKDYFRI